MAQDYERDMVFIGLTRPPMWMGVGYNWLWATGMASIMAFLLVTPLMGVIIFPILHIVGLVLYAKDPQLVSVIVARLKVGGTGNRKFWQGNSYSG